MAKFRSLTVNGLENAMLVDNYRRLQPIGKRKIFLRSVKSRFRRIVQQRSKQIQLLANNNDIEIEPSSEADERDLSEWYYWSRDDVVCWLFVGGRGGDGDDDVDLLTVENGSRMMMRCETENGGVLESIKKRNNNRTNDVSSYSIQKQTITLQRDEFFAFAASMQLLDNSIHTWKRFNGSFHHSTTTSWIFQVFSVSFFTLNFTSLKRERRSTWKTIVIFFHMLLLLLVVQVILPNTISRL